MKKLFFLILALLVCLACAGRTTSGGGFGGRSGSFSSRPSLSSRATVTTRPSRPAPRIVINTRSRTSSASSTRVNAYQSSPVYVPAHVPAPTYAVSDPAPPSPWLARLCLVLLALLVLGIIAAVLYSFFG